MRQRQYFIANGTGREDTLSRQREKRVYLKDDTEPTAPNPFNLGGGQLHFFIAEWTDPDWPGGMDPEWTFYRSVQPFPIGITDRWTRTTLDLSSDSAWRLCDHEGLGPPKPLRQLLDTPQQWGFAILGGSGPPSGRLGVDTLTIVPEPGTLALLAATAVSFLGLMWRRPRGCY